MTIRYATMQNVAWAGRYLDPDLAYLLLFIISHENSTEQGVAYFCDPLDCLSKNALPMYRSVAAYDHLKAYGILIEVEPDMCDIHEGGVYFAIDRDALERVADIRRPKPEPTVNIGGIEF